MSFDKVHIACAALTGTIYIGRINKAGDAFSGSKKDVTNEVKKALIEHMLSDCPADAKGMAQKFSWDGGKTQYEIIVRRNVPIHDEDCGLCERKPSCPAYEVGDGKFARWCPQSPDVDELVRTVLADCPVEWNQLQRIAEVERRCAEAGLKPPHANTIRRRINGNTPPPKRPKPFPAPQRVDLPGSFRDAAAGRETPS